MVVVVVVGGGERGGKGQKVYYPLSIYSPPAPSSYVYANAKGQFISDEIVRT